MGSGDRPGSRVADGSESESHELQCSFTINTKLGSKPRPFRFPGRPIEKGEDVGIHEQSSPFQNRSSTYLDV